MQLTDSGQRGPIEHARRDQIVATAHHHFRHYGYEKTTISDLAKAIGFSTAYIYKFFDSKQAIGEAVCAVCLGKISADVWRVIESAESFSLKIKDIFRTLARHARELSQQESRLCEMVAAAQAERWRVFVALEAALHDAIAHVVEGGRAAGEFERKTPIDDVCNGILLALEPLRNPTLWLAGTDDIDAQAASLASFVLRSLAA